MLDLTLGPSFKVKQWFTGFGELSFRWIQICIGLQCVGIVFLCITVRQSESHFHDCYLLTELERIEKPVKPKVLSCDK